MPVSREEAMAELQRRGVPVPAGPSASRAASVSADDARAELMRRGVIPQQANAAAPGGQPPVEQDSGIMATLGRGASAVGEFFAKPVLDARDVYQQGLGPGLRLPESVGERRDRTSDTALQMAPFMMGGGVAAPGAKAVAQRMLGSGLGVATADAGQQAIQTGSVDPRQVATAAALGAGGQGVGEAVGALAPMAVRGLFRGGEKGRAGVQSAIDDAARFGETPTVAQATQSSFLDSMESLLAKTPGGAGRIRDVARRTTDNVRQGVERVAQQGMRGDLDSETAGRAIIGGVKEFHERFQAKAAPLFDAITSKVGADTPVQLTNTMSAAQKLTTPVAGAEKTSQRFTSSFIRELAGDLAEDAAQNNGQIPFAALQRVRGLVGEKLSNPSIASDVPTAQLKQLYGALSDDIRAAAGKAGPEAQQAFQRANKYYSAGMGRMEGTLEPLVRNKVPEKVFDAIVRGGKSGPTQIRTVMRSLTPEQQDVVTGAVIRRMGTAVPSQQGAEGAEFSFNSLLTQWNQLDKGAKDAMFKRGRNVVMGQDLDALARYAERVKEASKAFANPSGTSGATIGGTLGLLSAGSVVASPVLGPGALTLPLLYGTGAGSANLGARLMTSPKFVHWLAQSTKLKPNGLPAHIARLSGISQKEDPETQDAILRYLDMMQAPEAVAAN
jgi:hypothetical protein